MNDSELRSTVIATLLSIAPEVDAALLQDKRPLRLQVDLDSMDWLNFLIGLSQQLQVAIAESDYADLVTLDDLLAYLRARLAPRAA
jgi:acyl carrier protein